MKPYILGAIFARGGSKGIPRKNIRLLANKPLIAYALETAQGIPLIDRLIVSTDDDEIAETARRFGAEVPFMRPKELATDNSPEILSWKHAIETIEKQGGKNIDILVSVPTTSPLRNSNDVERCIEKLISSDCDGVITVTKAHRNPYFNMVTIDKNEGVHLVMKNKNSVTQRQEAPIVYDVTTVAYAVRCAFIRKAQTLTEGRIKAVIIPEERALDIDTIFDFEVAEFLMSKKEVKK